MIEEDVSVPETMEVEGELRQTKELKVRRKGYIQYWIS